MNYVFGDESYDPREKRVYAVAGLFGSEQEWKEFEAAWVGLTRGKEIHAAECEFKERLYTNNS